VQDTSKNAKFEGIEDEILKGENQFLVKHNVDFPQLFSNIENFKVVLMFLKNCSNSIKIMKQSVEISVFSSISDLVNKVCEIEKMKRTQYDSMHH
jgi:hypothetical protein